MQIASFYDAALDLNVVAAEHGLATVAFYGGRDTKRHRTMRGRHTGSPVIYVDLGHSDDECLRAMIDGLLVANGLGADDPLRLHFTDKEILDGQTRSV